MVRVTGGEWKGRTLKVPPGQETRPTQSRLREAIFNVLQCQVVDARVLDLFAGSGALGFESLSRGADHVVFVESHRRAADVIRQNIDTLKVNNRTQLRIETVEQFLKNRSRDAQFDLIFADPPYSAGEEIRLLQDWDWKNILTPSGRLILEWSPLKMRAQIKKGTSLQPKNVPTEAILPEKVGALIKVREKQYGETVLTIYALSNEVNSQEGSL